MGNGGGMHGITSHTIMWDLAPYWENQKGWAAVRDAGTMVTTGCSASELGGRREPEEVPKRKDQFCLCGLMLPGGDRNLMS